MEKHDLIRRLAALKPRLIAEGVEHLAIFGSRARGDNRPDSDIDMLVDVRASIRFSMLDLIGVQHIVEDELGLQTSAVMRRGLTEEFRREIHDDVIEVF